MILTLNEEYNEHLALDPDTPIDRDTYKALTWDKERESKAMSNTIKQIKQERRDDG